VTVPTTAATNHSPTDVPSFFATLAGGAVSVHDLKVDPVLDKARNPNGIDLLDPDVAGVRLLMAQVLPGSVSPSNDNIRVRLVNPLGDPQLTYQAVARLAYVGANVVIVNEVPGTVPARSTIEYQQPEEAAAAALYAPVLGGADVRPNGPRIDGIDVTMTLGDSFRTFMAAETAKTTTTTEAATTTTSTSTTSTTVAPTTTTRKKKRG
jgi:hypothetical protein